MNEILTNNSKIVIDKNTYNLFDKEIENFIKEMANNEIKKYIANYFYDLYVVYGNDFIRQDNIFNYLSVEDFLWTNSDKKDRNGENIPHHAVISNEYRAFNREDLDSYIDFIKNFVKTKLDKTTLTRKSINSKTDKILKSAGFDINNLPLDITDKKLFKIFRDRRDENYVLANLYDFFSYGEHKNKNLIVYYNDGCKLLKIQHSLDIPPIDAGLEKDKIFFKNLLIETLPLSTASDTVSKSEKKMESKIRTLKQKLNEKNKLEIRSYTDYISLHQNLYKSIFSIYNYIETYKNGTEKQYPEKERRLQQLNKIWENTADSLIDKIAQFYANNIIVEKLPISIEELFKYEECKKNIWKYTPANIYLSLYVDEKTKAEISSIANFNPKDDYPKARSMYRHFYIHAGGTNTGKTYNSIQRLKSAETGAYLAPLRLLALENQENMLNSGVRCSLTTGEEEDIIPDATHISSTVEKANYDKKYKVVVIDECQLVSDTDRGWAWTQAILGMQAPEIHLCTATNAVDLLCKIIEDCGDTYEVIIHERVTPLIVEDTPFNDLKEVQPGDALILFSKKQVLSTAAQLNEIGINCSVIYGALPYDTRKRQFNRFLSGETNVVVSTDAIAMGLNLPIKRIVFLASEKFDGHNLRQLTDEEVKQIAGRAGRRGIYPEGFVTTYDDMPLQELIDVKSKEIKRANINFPASLTAIDRDLISTIKVWSTMTDEKLYRKTDIMRLVNLINMMPDEGLTKTEKLQLANIPFSEDEIPILELWKEYIKSYINHETTLKKPRRTYLADIDALEMYYKQLDLYYSFSKNMNFEIDLEWLKKEKLDIAKQINEELVSKISSYTRKCSCCGEPLEWDNYFSLCENCFQSRKYKKGKRPHNKY